MELVWCVRRNIDGVARSNDGLLAAEGHLHLAVKNDEGLFKVVTMRPRPATRRHMHVDHAEAAVSIFTGDGDRIRISYKTNMLCSWTV